MFSSPILMTSRIRTRVRLFADDTAMYLALDRQDNSEIQQKNLESLERRVKQGRRRVLKSGTAIGRHRRSARAEGRSRRRARERDFSPSRKGCSGDLPPQEIF